MTKLDVTISDLLRQYKYKSLFIRRSIVMNVLELIDKMHKNGICHGDPHTDNFMVSSAEIAPSLVMDVDRFKLVKYRYYVIDLATTDDLNDERMKDDYLIFISTLNYYFNINDLKNIIKPLKILNDEEMNRALS